MLCSCDLWIGDAPCELGGSHASDMLKTMNDSTHDVLRQALNLPPTARAVLATELVASLEHSTVDDPVEVKQEWAGEISRRLQDVLEGRVETVPFEEAIARAREAVAEVRRSS